MSNEMPATDRDLAIEVCHDLINRVLRSESDDLPCSGYTKIYRDQEAALRRLIAQADELARVREVLRQNEKALDRILDVNWPSILALNLYIAAGLCKAYEAGTDQIRALWDRTDGDLDQSKVVDAWEPGCGRPWESEGYRVGGFE